MCVNYTTQHNKVWPLAARTVTEQICQRKTLAANVRTQLHAELTVCSKLLRRQAGVYTSHTTLTPAVQYGIATG